MSYKKGRAVEAEINNIFWNTGQWAGVRAPASGRGTKWPQPDWIGSNGIITVAAQIKYSSSNVVYIDSADVDLLYEFCMLFGAEPFIIAKFCRAGIWIESPSVLYVTPGGNYRFDCGNGIKLVDFINKNSARGELSE